MPILGPQGQGTAGGTDITSALKGITLQISALVKSIPVFFNSVISKADSLYVALSGSTMTGPLILSADPTSTSSGLQAATKNYVDQSAGRVVAVNIYSSSQNITIPSATQAYVQMWGATGGSGGVSNSTSNGTGAGGYLEKYLDGLTSGNTLIYTQGAAGAAGTSGGGAGNDAGPTTLASGTETIGTLTCNGSNGTINGATGPISYGGTATDGDINITGQTGVGTNAGNLQIGGMTFYSSGADGVHSTSSAAGNPGNPGGLKIVWYS